MITWLAAHAHEIGWCGIGLIVGVVFAAWRQVRLETCRSSS